MKIEVKGIVYDVNAALYRARLDSLIWLKENANMSVSDVNAAIKRLADSQGTAQGLWDYLSDLDNLKAWRGLMWLCRRHVGETRPNEDGGSARYLTLDEAADFSVMDVAWVVEDDAKGATPEGPKAPTDFAAVDALPELPQETPTTP